MRGTYHLHNATQAHSAMDALWKQLKPWLVAGHQFELNVRDARRTTEQNARMWAMLSDVSRQVEWYGKKLDAEDWKHVFSAALRKSQVVPGIDGGFVVLGQSTSRMSRAELSELMELIEAFGAERGVVFSAPEMEATC
jgi:hypothetical protein